ncbi:MAG: transcription antitermination protein NusB [Muribaculaceae bacterium]|nr:transcription antitermination protein NusB [Muribaculaceae bacterium]
MELTSMLQGRMYAPARRAVIAYALESTAHLDTLYGLAYSPDDRVSLNALWCLSLLPRSVSFLTFARRDELIDHLLAGTTTSKRRVIMQLLRGIRYDKDTLRSDLLDYCLSRINSQTELPAVRAYAIYIAYDHCRHYPELLAELASHLDLLATQPLSPGLRAALRSTRARLSPGPKREKTNKKEH